MWQVFLAAFAQYGLSWFCSNFNFFKITHSGLERKWKILVWKGKSFLKVCAGFETPLFCSPRGSRKTGWASCLSPAEDSLAQFLEGKGKERSRAWQAPFPSRVGEWCTVFEDTAFPEYKGVANSRTVHPCEAGLALPWGELRRPSQCQTVGGHH